MVLEAEDVPSAWKVVQIERPDLVILDLRMPAANGWELAQAIKADATLIETKIVVVTASQAEADRLRAQELLVDAFLTKPFSPLALIQLVDQVLGSGSNEGGRERRS